MVVGVRSETKNVFNCGGYPVDWRSQRSVALLSLFFFLYILTPPYHLFSPYPSSAGKSQVKNKYEAQVKKKIKTNKNKAKVDRRDKNETIVKDRKKLKYE